MSKLSDMPPLVMKHVRNLVPMSLFEEITSFCLTPEHPNWNNKPDIVITTTRGELIEIADRRPTNSYVYQNDCEAIEVRFHYKKSGKSPNYVIRTLDKLFVVGYNDENILDVIAKFNNVTSYELKDENMCGEAQISIWCYDDVIPSVLNENYVIEIDSVFHRNEIKDDEMIVSVLMEQLTEARLNTGHNMKTLKNNLRLQQEIFHSSSELAKYHIDDIEKNESTFDKICIGHIWQKVYNNKWIIGIPIENLSEVDIEEIEVLLKNEDSYVFHYITSYYNRCDTAPLFWMKLKRGALQPKQCIMLIIESVIPLFDNSPKIYLKGALKYKCGNQTYSPPLQHIEIKALDVVNGSLNPVCQSYQFGHEDILALYSTSLMTKLDIYFVNDATFPLLQLLKENLDYVDDVKSLPNIFRHIKSPLHINHGSVIQIIEESKTEILKYKIAVLTRSESQLLMLINIMYDLLPSRIVIVPSEYEIEMKNKKNFDNNAMDEEDLFTEDIEYQCKSDIMDFGCALYKEMSLVSDYLKNCINAMSEEKLSSDQSKRDNSMNIDVTALGMSCYRDFWKKLRAMIEEKNKIIQNIKI